MIRNVCDHHGNYIRSEEAEPECGKDFCDKCGDCLSCYGGDPCPFGDDDEHSWVRYEDAALSSAAPERGAR